MRLETGGWRLELETGNWSQKERDRLGTRHILTAGTIETNINKDDLADPAKRADMTRRIPLARLGEPDDIAQPVIFFASDMAKYCTGASLLVDGGAAISLQ